MKKQEKNNKQLFMPQQSAELRVKNFDEVALGLKESQALKEAQRCLNCKNAKCISGCPVGINIPGFIQLIKNKKYKEAAEVIKKDNLLPAVCGRVCPQEDQCEKACILSKKGKPINIGYLERFVSDYGIKNSLKSPPTPGLWRAGKVHGPEKGKDTIDHQLSTINSQRVKVAVVGSGPAGLTCASELKKLGYDVVIFEALHKPGGVLTYGIPSFRLPNKIVEYEIENLKEMGVEIKTNYVIGRTKTIDELLSEGFSAIYIAVGAGHPVFMGIPGEDLNYVYSANEFLTRINLMEAYKFPEADTPVILGKRVAVIGGGNTAMDAARSALRLPETEKVTLLYRRTRSEMPARIEEIKHAEEEGIEFMFLTSPVRYIGDEKNKVRRVECIKMKLGEPDESGRRRPVPIERSEFSMDIDSAIVAIGTDANPLILKTTDGLRTNKWSYISIDQEGRTSKKRVYAGGDIVTGSATVIEAMGAGKRAAHTIDKDLSKASCKKKSKG
jgi:glutamate synthase (NADPH) small chain